MLIFFSTTTTAQQDVIPVGQRDMIKEQIAAYIEKLDLSEDQKAEYLEISKRYGEQMKALKHSTRGRMEKYQELKSIRKDKNKEMKLVLTADQYKIYKELQEQHHQEMRAKRGNRRL